MTERASYRVAHETRYTYSDVVTSAHQLAHLRPRATPWQKIKSHKLVITPRPVEQAAGADYFGNDILRFMIDAPHDELSVRAESVVEVESHAPDAGAVSPLWEAGCAPRGNQGCASSQNARSRAADQRTTQAGRCGSGRN
jgi:transglutaminase-like putative cysteine protease